MDKKNKLMRKPGVQQIPPGTISVAELASMFGMSVNTVYVNLRNGPCNSGENAVDLRKVRDIRVGQKRRWLKTSALEYKKELGLR